MSAPRRAWLSRWHYVVLLGGALAVAAFVGNWLYQSHLHDQELQRVLAETHQREPAGWRLEELEANRRPVADAENSALTLAAAKALRPKDWPYWVYLRGVPNDDERDPDRMLEVQRVLDEQWPLNRRLPEHVFRALRNEICRGHECLDRARLVIDQPFGRGQIVYLPGGIMTLLPNLDLTNQFITAFTYEAQQRAEEGDLGGALESLRCAIQCGRAVGDEPCLISQYWRMMASGRIARLLERILAQGEPPSPVLAALQKLLEEEAPERHLLIGARGERAMMDAMMEGLERRQLTYAQVGRLMGSYHGSNYGLEDWAFWASSGDPSQNRAALLRLGNRFVAIAELPIEERQAPMREFKAEIEKAPRFVSGVYRFAPQSHQACNRYTTMIRCGIVALALERYRQEHRQWPDALDQLAPAYLDAVPRDPIDGQPLRYRTWENGVVIYSVGGDGADDGGNLPERWSYQHTEYEEKGRDCGLRLYDVKQRRLP